MQDHLNEQDLEETFLTPRTPNSFQGPPFYCRLLLSVIPSLSFLVAARAIREGNRHFSRRHRSLVIFAPSSPFAGHLVKELLDTFFVTMYINQLYFFFCMMFIGMLLQCFFVSESKSTRIKKKKRFCKKKSMLKNAKKSDLRKEVLKTTR